MKAQETFLAAEVPRHFVVLGQELLPFSLWHCELLLWLGNGFVTPGAAVGLGDLVQGVFFCCQTWEDGTAALRDPQLGERLEAWGESVGEQLAQENPKKFLEEGIVLEEKALLFAEYLREGSGRPELLPADGEGGRAPGAPMLQLLKLFLMERLRMTESQAMNYSFAKACHAFFAHHELQGTAKIANEEEADEMRAHEELLQDPKFLKECRREAREASKRLNRKKGKGTHAV
jgi:hypothetical protein